MTGDTKTIQLTDAEGNVWDVDVALWKDDVCQEARHATPADLLAAGYVPASRLLAIETELAKVTEDARRMHYLGNMIRSRTQPEQDELTRLMRKYTPLTEAPPSPVAHEPAQESQASSGEAAGDGVTHDRARAIVAGNMREHARPELACYIDQQQARQEQSEREAAEKIEALESSWHAEIRATAHINRNFKSLADDRDAERVQKEAALALGAALALEVTKLPENIQWPVVRSLARKALAHLEAQPAEAAPVALGWRLLSERQPQRGTIVVAVQPGRAPIVWSKEGEWLGPPGTLCCELPPLPEAAPVAKPEPKCVNCGAPVSAPYKCSFSSKGVPIVFLKHMAPPAEEAAPVRSETTNFARAFECCGGNDETPQGHCADCSEHPACSLCGNEKCQCKAAPVAKAEAPSEPLHHSLNENTFCIRCGQFDPAYPCPGKPAEAPSEPAGWVPKPEEPVVIKQPHKPLATTGRVERINAAFARALVRIDYDHLRSWFDFTELEPAPQPPATTGGAEWEEEANAALDRFVKEPHAPSEDALYDAIRWVLAGVRDELGIKRP